MVDSYRRNRASHKVKEECALDSLKKENTFFVLSLSPSQREMQVDTRFGNFTYKKINN